MSGLQITTAGLSNLLPSSAGDPAKSSSGVNAAFTGVLNRVATQQVVAEAKSSKTGVGQAFSGKQARSDAGTAGADEPEAEPLDETSLGSTTPLASIATLDISALAQAALMPTGSAVPQVAKAQTAGQNAIPKTAPATAASTPSPSAAPTAATATAALQAIVQQPAPLGSAQGAVNQGTGSLSPRAVGTDGPTSPQPKAALAPTAAAQTSAATASAPTSPAVAPTTGDSDPIPTSTTGGSTVVTRTEQDTGAASSSVPPAAPGMATGAPAPAVPSPAAHSQEASQANTKPMAAGAPQSSQASTDAAQAAAVDATPQLLQTATTLEAPAPAALEVGSTAQPSTRSSPAASPRAGNGSGKAPVPETNATASPSSLDSASGKRGKDKTSAATGVAAASNDPSVVATPAQQVVTALQSLGKDVVETAARRSTGATAASTDVSTPQSAVPSSLKTLTITLNPANLGPVSITMRLQADTVDIRIAVSNPNTLHLLDKDKHILAAAVEAMGGSRDNLQVGTLAQMSGSGDPTSTGGQNQNAPGRQDAASSDSSSNGRQAQGQGRSTLQDASLSDADDPTSTPSLPQPRALDGSLYL